MNEQDNHTNEAFMEVTSRRVEEQDKKITALEGKVKDISGIYAPLHDLLNRIEELHGDVKQTSLLSEKLTYVSNQLDLVSNDLRQPATSQVIHHHHVSKLVWIAAGLFIVLCLVCSGWYVTSSKLNCFIANDTKYREMRLDTTYESLQFYLDQLDSQYKVRPDMREKVLEQEAEYRLNFERLHQAEQLKKEAENLEKAVRQR